MNIKVIVLFLISIQFCFSQRTFDTENNISTNIYLYSIEKYFETIEKKTTEKDIEYYIEKRFIKLDSLPKSISGHKINWVKNVNINNLFETNKTSFIHLKINPINIKKEIFYISIIPFFANYKYKKLQVLSEIFEFQYEFDKLLNRLKYKNLIKM